MQVESNRIYIGSSLLTSAIDEALAKREVIVLCPRLEADCDGRQNLPHWEIKPLERVWDDSYVLYNFSGCDLLDYRARGFLRLESIEFGKVWAKLHKAPNEVQRLWRVEWLLQTEGFQGRNLGLGIKPLGLLDVGNLDTEDFQALHQHWEDWNLLKVVESYPLPGNTKMGLAVAKRHCAKGIEYHLGYHDAFKDEVIQKSLVGAFDSLEEAKNHLEFMLSQA